MVRQHSKDTVDNSGGAEWGGRGGGNAVSIYCSMKFPLSLVYLCGVSVLALWGDDVEVPVQRSTVEQQGAENL